MVRTDLAKIDDAGQYGDTLKKRQKKTGQKLPARAGPQGGKRAARQFRSDH